MKLTEISFQNLGQVSNHTLGRLSPGVNFIYGEKETGKTRLCQFIRDLIFGSTNYSHQAVQNGTIVAPAGRMGLIDGEFEFQLRRNFATDGSLEVIDVHGNSITGRQNLPWKSSSTIYEQTPFASTAELADPQTFDLLFNFSLSRTSNNLPRLCRFLHSRLNVPVGESGLGDETAHLAWQRASQQRAARLAELATLIEQLKTRRQSALDRQAHERSNDQNRLQQIELELQQLSSQLSESESVVKRNRIIELDAELMRIKESIEATIQRNNIQTAQKLPQSYADLQCLLYVRLDELDHQIYHWRSVQSTVQARRISLKQEMDQWNELNLNSPSHPYHNAQKLLTSIEKRINQNDQLARQWESNPAQHTDPSSTVRSIQTLCQSMRDDLHNLGQELGLQFKHLRHRAAAIELKHFRELFEETSQQIDRLLKLKELAITQLRQFDVAGADLVVRAEKTFLDLAGQHGYLEARRRTIGPWPNLEIAAPLIDVTPLQSRQQLLLNEREVLQRWIVDFEAKQTGLRFRQNQLIEERKALEACISSHHNAELARFETELVSLTAEYESLLRAVEQDRNYVRPAAHPILLRASQLLQTGSGGQLQKVWIVSQAQSSLAMVIDQNGRSIQVDNLERYQQDLVYLALAMAAKEALQNRKIDFPVMVDDAFINFSRERVQLLITLLDDLQRAGHQVLLFTNHQYLADRIPTAPVFELPVPAIIPDRPQPYTDIYRREATSHTNLPSTVVNVETFAPNTTHSPPIFVANRNDDEFFNDFESIKNSSIVQPNQLYPLSKYPPVSESINQNEHLIVSYPLRTDDLRYLREPEDSRSIPFRTERNQNQILKSANRVTPIAVDEVGDALGFAPTVDDLTSLDALDLFHLDDLRRLAELEIETVSQLLALDPELLSEEIRQRGFGSDQINRWQSVVWLLCNVPGMRTEDARILVACGVTEPEHLATSQPQVLLERLERYLSSRRNQSADTSITRFSIARINGWTRALQSTRHRWQQADGLSRLSRRRHRRDGISSSRSHRNRSNPDMQIVAMQRPSERSRENREQREPREIRSPRMRTPDRSSQSRSTQPRTVQPRTVSDSDLVRTRSSAQSLQGEKNRFYLELKDHIQAAPSIGPKTAERFERIGIHTVAEFLNQTAESMAGKLKYRRITSDIIRSWQDQTRLVCRIPNLRGHDAQLLVACDFIEPEKIAAMHPQKLLDIILPFSRTKEGLKIIRTGREPDLEEVTNWIRWASMTRSLHAA